MPTAQSDVQETIQRQMELVLAALVPETLGEQMADELIASMPEFAVPVDADFRAGLTRSCTSNVREAFRVLASGAPAESISPPTEATAWVYELVHRGLPIATLLRAYRLGHALAERRLEEVSEELGIEPDIRWRVLARASRTFFGYVDAISTQLVAEYEQERGRRIRGAAAARAELVRKIIARERVNPRSATDTLRYDVNRCHLAFIVWSSDDAPPRSGSLELAAATLAQELNGGPVLLIPIGERVLWGWTSGDQDRHATNTRLTPLPDGLRAALGQPAAGLEGMATSHAQAREARRVGEVMRCRPGTSVRYGSVALTALLTVDPAQAARFARAQLGELAEDSDVSARLRATLRVYLEENMSPARTARRLGIHQNTVVNRVRRAEEILGHPVDHGRLELEVALRLAEGLPGLAAARL